MSLYLDYRPTSLEEVYGNEALKSAINGLFKANKVPHSILLQGPTGCGKTTIARIIANMLECDMEKDLVELDSAQFRGIDTVRDIRRNSQFMPIGGGVKVFIVD